MESYQAETILRKLWNIYGISIENDIKKTCEYTNDELVEEFYFVVLGGFGISYDLNYSALKVLKEKGFFKSSLYDNEIILSNTIYNLKMELSKKQFEPKTTTNEYRKYRFLETKPVIVANAGHWLWNECNWNLKSKLGAIDTVSARNWLCECPGFGMKSASWFLRNAGLSYDCAVLDVHLLRFLRNTGFNIPERLSNSMYLNIEDALRNVCNKIGVTLGKMDYLLWLLGRNGMLSYVR